MKLWHSECTSLCSLQLYRSISRQGPPSVEARRKRSLRVPPLGDLFPLEAPRRSRYRQLAQLQFRRLLLLSPMLHGAAWLGKRHRLMLTSTSISMLQRPS